jgi:hypothetical protein
MLARFDADALGSPPGRSAYNLLKFSGHVATELSAADDCRRFEDVQMNLLLHPAVLPLGTLPLQRYLRK